MEVLNIKPKGTSAKSNKTKEVRKGAISTREMGHLRKAHFAEHGLQKLQRQISSSRSSFLSDVHQSARRHGSHLNEEKEKSDTKAPANSQYASASYQSATYDSVQNASTASTKKKVSNSESSFVPDLVCVCVCVVCVCGVCVCVCVL